MPSVPLFEAVLIQTERFIVLSLQKTEKEEKYVEKSGHWNKRLIKQPRHGMGIIPK